MVGGESFHIAEYNEWRKVRLNYTPSGITSINLQDALARRIIDGFRAIHSWVNTNGQQYRYISMVHYGSGISGERFSILGVGD